MLRFPPVSHFATTLLCCLLPLLTSADEFPIAPLSRTHHETWGDVFRLTNRFLDILVSPEHDGVVSFRGPLEPNRLLAPATLTPVNREALTEALPRLGGVVQPRWQARGWITSEGGQTVLLTQTFGAPLHLRITHMLTLPQEAETLNWSTRITAIAPVDPVRAVIFHLPSETLLWSSAWRIEGGPTLETVTGTLTETDGVKESLPPQPALRSLPPQGWTLMVDGTLRPARPETADE